MDSEEMVGLWSGVCFENPSKTSKSNVSKVIKVDYIIVINEKTIQLFSVECSN